MGASKNKRQRQQDGFGFDRKSPKDVEAEIERKKYRRNVKIIGAILIVFVIAVVVFTSSFSYRHIPAVEVNNTNFSAAEYNYYHKTLYYQYYNNYASTYGDYAEYFMPDEEALKNETLTFMAQIQMLNQEAEKNGFVLSDDVKAQIEEEVETLTGIAKENGYATVNGYFAAYYGKGMTADIFRECVTASQIASEYTASLTDSYDFSESEIKNYYKEHEDEYDIFTFRYFYFSGSAVEADEENGIAGVDEETAMANAKASAEEFASKVTDEASFGDLAYSYAGEDEKETYSDRDVTLNNVQGKSLNEAYASWLASATRNEGDVTTAEAESGWYVLYYIGRDNNNYNTKNVRHILIESDEENEEKLAEAEAVLNEWKSEAATEESFAEMADKYSSDTAAGGLYENVYKGQMVTEFNDWIYDEARKPGDTEIVFSESYGYHIIYFVGEGELCSDYMAETDMKNNKYGDWLEEQMENYDVKTTWWFNIAT